MSDSWLLTILSTSWLLFSFSSSIHILQLLFRLWNTLCAGSSALCSLPWYSAWMVPSHPSIFCSNAIFSELGLPCDGKEILPSQSHYSFFFTCVRNFFEFLLLFNYSCLHFLPIPPPHTSQTHLPQPHYSWSQIENTISTIVLPHRNYCSPLCYIFLCHLVYYLNFHIWWWSHIYSIHNIYLEPSKVT